MWEQDKSFLLIFKKIGIFLFLFFFIIPVDDVRIKRFGFKLALTQYNQNLYRINFIEFIIALSNYALFRYLSSKPYNHVTIQYIKSMTEKKITDRGTQKTPSHKISHDEYYEKWDTIDKTKHKPTMAQPRIWHTRITTRSLTCVFYFNHCSFLQFFFFYLDGKIDKKVI